MAIKIGGMELYDVPELAGLLSIQEKTVRKLLKEGKLKGKKLAKKWYVTDESLRAYFHEDEPASHAWAEAGEDEDGEISRTASRVIVDALELIYFRRPGIRLEAPGQEEHDGRFS